ncbi:hypothetical protein [uncultured Roseobacter sp.]|uniref:hypothetical protein n=1 Tax=uncultured Roseobacter sp. TaxID=114847 RepID=UPI002637F250|nr:hypothetical protein [uncultured Roseobacter sp.]
MRCARDALRACQGDAQLPEMYHAGNLADVHRHGLLARVIRAHQPLDFIEIDAIRAIRDQSKEAATHTRHPMPTQCATPD